MSLNFQLRLSHREKEKHIQITYIEPDNLIKFLINFHSVISLSHTHKKFPSELNDIQLLYWLLKMLFSILHNASDIEYSCNLSTISELVAGKIATKCMYIVFINNFYAESR